MGERCTIIASTSLIFPENKRHGFSKIPEKPRDWLTQR